MLLLISIPLLSALASQHCLTATRALGMRMSSHHSGDCLPALPAPSCFVLLAQWFVAILFFAHPHRAGQGILVSCFALCSLMHPPRVSPRPTLLLSLRVLRGSHPFPFPHSQSPAGSHILVLAWQLEPYLHDKPLGTLSVLYCPLPSPVSSAFSCFLSY